MPLSKIIIIEKSFTSGCVVGWLRGHLSGNGSGHLAVLKESENYVKLEIMTYSPLVMSWVEDRLRVKAVFFIRGFRRDTSKL